MPMPLRPAPTRFTRLLAAALLALGLASTNVRAAQPAPTANVPPGLSPTVVEDAGSGVSLHLPEGAKITKYPQSTRRISVEASDLSWVATLEVIETVNEEFDLKKVMDRAIEESRKDTKSAKVRSRETIEVAGHQAEFAILDLVLANDVEETRVYAALSPRPRHFVIYGLRGDGAKADKFIPLTRATIGTIRFRDPAEIAAELDAGFLATQKALDRLTQADYTTALDPDRWYRIHRKTDAGDREVAYHRIQERVGQRGEVGKLGHDPRTFNETERQQGLLVIQTSRFVQANEKTTDATVHEVVSEAWMSFDRKSELFSIRHLTYQRDAAAISKTPRYKLVAESAITGTRGNGRMDVTIVTPEGNPLRPSFTDPALGYVCQAEQTLLYRLLNPGQAGAYYMYLFLPQSGEIKRRKEVITAASTTGVGSVSADRFTVESILAPDQPPLIKTIDARGNILRIVTGEGQITEPSTPEEVKRFWSAQGLPTGALQ